MGITSENPLIPSVEYSEPASVDGLGLHDYEPKSKRRDIDRFTFPSDVPTPEPLLSTKQVAL